MGGTGASTNGVGGATGGTTTSTGGTTTSTGGDTGTGGTTTSTGGDTSTGGTTTSTGGDTGTGGTTTGTGGDTATGGGATGGQGTGGVPPIVGPCDLYEDAGTPCVAAYSMIRTLASDYAGPLYQVRSDSSEQNTGSGGTTHDIGMTADGFADAAAQDSACSGTTCTVSVLYDQTGNGNDLFVAKAGLSAAGEYADDDDFESIADDDPLTVGGHNVYSLYTAARQGYRTPVGFVGNNMPLEQEPQGIYMLADGTHWGMSCCFDFGNVSPDPTVYTVQNALFFGRGFWGMGEGNGPWFLADFEGGLWAGGTNPGDAGWGALSDPGPANTDNPSLPVRFALGFLQTNETDWVLRMADLRAAAIVTVAYYGGLPKQMNNEGGIVLGVGGDNSNNSYGSFYEGAIVAGWPTDAATHAVLQNIQVAGYGE
jgi:hypothetical protein